VGEDHTFVEGVQAHRTDECATNDRPALVDPGLLEDVDRGGLIGDEHAFLDPAPPQLARSRVAAVRRRRIGGTLGQIDRHHVVRLKGESRPEGGIDHIVRRRNKRRDIAGWVGGVDERAKRGDRCHAEPSFHGSGA